MRERRLAWGDPVVFLMVLSKTKSRPSTAPQARRRCRYHGGVAPAWRSVRGPGGADRQSRELWMLSIMLTNHASATDIDAITATVTGSAVQTRIRSYCIAK
jgi:hypothetical protein